MKSLWIPTFYFSFVEKRYCTCFFVNLIRLTFYMETILARKEVFAYVCDEKLLLESDSLSPYLSG